VVYVLVVLFFVLGSIIVAIGLAIVLWVASKLDKRGISKVSSRRAGKLSNRAKE